MNVKRELGFLDGFSIASGAMISSGLFVLPGLAYLKLGPAVCVAYFLAGVMVVPAMLSKAELATAMPKADGTYFFIDRSMGAGLGTLAGLSAWFSQSFKSAFAMLGIGVFTTLIYPDLTYWYIKLIAVACCVCFAIIHFWGVGHAGKLQIAFVLGLTALLIIYIARGLPLVTFNHFSPFMKGTPRTLFATAGLVFVSYGGLTNITNIAEEVKNPARNIPFAMITALSVVTLLYVLTIFVTVGILGERLIKVSGQPSLTPVLDGAYFLMGPWGRVVLAIGAVLAFVFTGNAGIMAAARDPMAMSRDGLLPKFFEHVHPKYHTPYRSIFFTVGFMIAMILLLDLEMLVKTASTIKILLFCAENLAVIIMRESGVQNYQPKFKAPLYPWIQIAGLIGYGFLLVEMGAVPLSIAAIFLLLSLLWYWLYGRIRTTRESALVHLVKRITAKELHSYALNEELKEILLEQDELIESRFDILVKNAIVLDLPYTMNMEETFHTIAETLSPRIDLPPEQVYELLLERERDTSTIIAPGLAIPHVMLPGNKKVDILLARCQDGIHFTPDTDPVHAIFVLAGTYDERNFHLQALMSIAKVVQKQDFMTRWLKATQQEELRDIVLLERTR